MQRLYVGENNLVRWKGLKDRRTGEFVNDAELTMTVYTLGGSAVANGSAISLTYVAESDGDYDGIVPKNAAITVDTRYKVVASANSADGLREIECIATKHRER